MIDPVKLINRKLTEAFRKPWGSRGSFRFEIAEPDRKDHAEGFSGVLRLYVRAPSGTEPEVLERQFEDLRNTEDVDDFLADVLSNLLAFHPAWPK